MTHTDATLHDRAESAALALGTLGFPGGAALLRDLVAENTALRTERDELKAAKWDVKHTDTMNDMVAMGLVRDAATGRAATLTAEVGRLRALLSRYLNETPLGHQPHMIASEARAALAPADNVAVKPPDAPS